MTVQEFRDSLRREEPPPQLSIALAGLWWDAKGSWPKAHSLVDDLEDATGCWVHAYLHRKEGDISNADYWYRKSGRKRPSGSLQEEWKTIAMELLP